MTRSFEAPAVAIRRCAPRCSAAAPEATPSRSSLAPSNAWRNVGELVARCETGDDCSCRHRAGMVVRRRPTLVKRAQRCATSRPKTDHQSDERCRSEQASDVSHSAHGLGKPVAPLFGGVGKGSFDQPFERDLITLSQAKASDGDTHRRGHVLDELHVVRCHRNHNS